ncbi:MAG TPA: hypothetical protein VIN03_08180 [Roseateles sp.]
MPFAVLVALFLAPAAAQALSVKHVETVYVQVSRSQGLDASGKQVVDGLVDRARHACLELKQAMVIASADGPFSDTPGPETLIVKSLLTAYGLNPDHIFGGAERLSAKGLKSTANTKLVRVELFCHVKKSYVGDGA